MTAYDDLDGTLDTWLGTAPAPVAPPEGLARILETSRSRRPRPSIVAGLGSSWMRGSTTAALRPALVFALVALLVLAFAGAVVLVGSRLVAPRTPAHTYVNEFVSAPDLSMPMAYPVLVPLLDRRVLVIGDDGDGGGTGTRALIYDPATGVSEPTGPMASSDSLWAEAAVRLTDGRVLVIGNALAQVFDPGTRQFTPAGPMLTPRSMAGVAVLPDGHVLIAGGYPSGSDAATSSAELFDPETLTFSPTGAMGTSHAEVSTATLSDGRVFVSPGASRLTAEIYDPSTGTFSGAGTMSTYYRNHSSIALPDGRVVVLGTVGMARDGMAQVWDPTSLTFLSGPYLPGQLAGATLLDDGRILVIGGATLSWARIYEPTAGVSQYMSTRSWHPRAVRLSDGRVLLVGGLTDGRIRPEGGGTLAPGVPTIEIFQ